MRLRKAELRGRVNKNLALRFGEKRLTSYAGLELIRRYFSLLDLNGQLRRWLGSVLPST